MITRVRIDPDVAAISLPAAGVVVAVLLALV